MSPLPRRALVLALALSPVAAGAPAGPALPGRDGPPRDEGDGSSAAALPLGPSPAERAALESLDRALAWLAARQAEREDGSFPTGDAERPAPVATTALAALAFMAAGHSAERGPYAHELARAVDYLVAHADADPRSPEYGYIGSASDQHSRMHGHGFATLALAEAYGMAPRSRGGGRLERTLIAAVRLIERTQGAEGGWWYDAQRSSSHEGSVTICLVQALRAARNSGVTVDREVVRRAEDYVRRSQSEDGRFRYMIGSERTSAALTAAAISTLNATGTYDDPAIESGTDALWRDLEARDLAGGARVEWPYYERLYIAQAFWQHHDPSHFARWIDDERRRVITDQSDLGHWDNRLYGRAYATSMNALFLALPGGVLPIFQR